MIELGLPELPVVVDPGCRLPHRRRDERGATGTALLSDARQPRALEHAHVLRHGGESHIEARREFTDCPVTGGESGENRTPRRVRERGEGDVEGRVLVNHVVYYCIPPADAQEGTSRTGQTRRLGAAGLSPPAVPTLPTDYFTSNRRMLE